jgi:hypothetical protein
MQSLMASVDISGALISVIAQGRYIAALLPYKRGLTRGTILIRLKASARWPTINVPWGKRQQTRRALLLLQYWELLRGQIWSGITRIRELRICVIVVDAATLSAVQFPRSCSEVTFTSICGIYSSCEWR